MDLSEDPFHISFHKIMSFYGFSNTQTSRERSLRHYMIIFVYLHNLLVQTCRLATLDFDLVSAAILFEMFVSSLIFMSLYYNLVVHNSTIQKLFLCLEEDWEYFKTDNERKVIQRHNYESKMFAVTFGFACIFFIACITLPSILRVIISNDKGLSSTDPLPMSTCFDYFLDREIYYYPLFIQQIIFIFISVIGGTTCFLTFFGFIHHICARFDIIKTKIHRPFIHHDNNDQSLIEPTDLSDWIIDIIQHLARTSEFKKLSNTLCGNFYLFQLLLAFLHVIMDFIYLFQIPNLLEREGGQRDACLLIFIVVSSLISIYINNFIGQRLIDCSTDVYKELCVIPIYKLSIKTQKLVLTTISMSERPCKISVGQFLVCSNESFGDLLRPALSFAMVLNQIQSM